MEKILILVDSGSDEHVCPRSFAPGTEVQKESAGAMRDAQGTAIETEWGEESKDAHRHGKGGAKKGSQRLWHRSWWGG